MTKPRAGLVVTLTLPFLAGCFGTLPRPLPPPGAQPGNVNGVVMGVGPDAERVEFARVDSLEWTDSSVIITGVVKGSEQPVASGTVETRTFAFADVSALLVHALDPGKTSALVALVGVGSVAVVAFMITGKTVAGGRVGGG